MFAVHGPAPHQPGLDLRTPGRSLMPAAGAPVRAAVGAGLRDGDFVLTLRDGASARGCR